MKKQLLLKKNEERRIINGHQWIFSNEVSSIRGNPITGDVVELLRYDEKFLGLCFFNPNSLIIGRYLSSENIEIDKNFFETRIKKALSLRKKLFPSSETYRLVHGESDFLPGLVIDKYNDLLSLQILSAGMQNKVDIICDALENLFNPKAIVARNDIEIRALEGLQLEKSVLRGNIETTIINDNDIQYEVDIVNGQKTGFFLDQRINRTSIRKYCKDMNVLDCFCNEGGFSLNASYAQAKSVCGIDISNNAITKAGHNAVLNNLNIEFKSADVFDELQKIKNENKNYDIVILDPPSFTKSKKNIHTALHGYKNLHSSAMQIIESGGFLITASCSHHISQEDFLDAIKQASVKAKRKIQLLELSGASPDHPTLLEMPETNYLKFAIFCVK